MIAQQQFIQNVHRMFTIIISNFYFFFEMLTITVYLNLLPFDGQIDNNSFVSNWKMFEKFI